MLPNDESQLAKSPASTRRLSVCSGVSGALGVRQLIVLAGCDKAHRILLANLYVGEHLTVE
jgi:hypothetical protein